MARVKGNQPYQGSLFMFERVARLWLTAIILGGNTVIFFVMLGLWLANGFSTSEFEQTVLAITPLLFAYGAPILSRIMTDLHDDGEDVNISPISFYVGIILPPMVQIMTLMLCIAKSYNYGFRSFDEFLLALGLIQTLFGAYVGIIISTFFPNYALAARRPTTSARSRR
jgi:hypothetical protein